MTLLSAVILQGVAASRPAAGTAGRLYYSTDTQVLERDNGSTWDEWDWPTTSAVIGSSRLVYRYTVTGSAKASIDTGVDTAQAGDNDWTGGDLLEVWIQARTDEAVTLGTCNITFNNDTGANYDQVQVQNTNATLAGSNSLAQTSLVPSVTGNSAAANYAGVVRLSIPGYARTTFYKEGELTCGTPEDSAADNRFRALAFAYKSTSAITRMKILAGSGNFQIGTNLTIYKRISS